MAVSLYRPVVLALAGNKWVENFAHKYGFQLGANRFVSGYTAEDAIREAVRLREQGIMTTLDQLGESVRSISESADYKDEYLRLLDKLHETGTAADISLKPTQLGLALDREQSYRLIREIVEKASAYGHFVRLDMEDHPYTDDTIRFAVDLRQEGFEQVGTVIQAYLHRSEKDVRQLTDNGMNVRLVKGAYKEPEAIAYQSMAKIREQFKHLIKMRLESGVYTAVATHDDAIIDWTKRYVQKHGFSHDQFEFQLLYGMRMDYQEQLAKEGYTVRSYVPYGRMWYPYFLRRLAERPENLWFVLKNLVKR